MDELRCWLLIGDPVIFDDMWAWLWEDEPEEDRKLLGKSLPKRDGKIVIRVHRRGKQ